MKIVGLQELCALPVGTIFSAYNVGADTIELCRRGEALRHNDSHYLTDYYCGEFNDFMFMDLLPQVNDSLKIDVGVDLAHPKVDYLRAWSRWGCQEPGALFLVFSPEDVQKLVLHLTGTHKEVLDA